MGTPTTHAAGDREGDPAEPLPQRAEPLPPTSPEPAAERLPDGFLEPLRAWREQQAAEYTTLQAYRDAQARLLQRYGAVENLTSHYVFALGAYRALYLLNWIYRYSTEQYYSQKIVWFAGVVQTALYCDFFYYYAKSKWSKAGGPMRLPSDSSGK